MNHLSEKRCQSCGRGCGHWSIPLLMLSPPCISVIVSTVSSLKKNHGSHLPISNRSAFLPHPPLPVNWDWLTRVGQRLDPAVPAATTWIRLTDIFITTSRPKSFKISSQMLTRCIRLNRFGFWCFEMRVKPIARLLGLNESMWAGW